LLAKLLRSRLESVGEPLELLHRALIGDRLIRPELIKAGLPEEEAAAWMDALVPRFSLPTTALSE